MNTLPKPKRDLVKTVRGLKGKKTAAITTAPADPAAGNGQSPTSAKRAAAQIETQTQIANRLFRQRAEKIDNAHVTVRAGENEWEPIYRIEIPELWSEAFDKIVKLRSRLYRKYPETIINIEFRPLRELAEAENTRRLAAK